MKKIIFILTLFLLIIFSITYAKDYGFNEARVYYIIKSDGEIEVINDLTYWFSGSYSRAWITVPIGNYEIKNASVSEVINGNEKFYTYHEETEERIPNTFDFTRNSKEYKITWFYRAQDTNKTFRIRYKISGALRVYDDVAEFYWKVWGEDFEKGLPALWVEVLLPREIENIKDINYWLHPKIEGKIGIGKDYKRIIAYVGNIPDHQWVEVRVVFPRYYLTNLDPNNVYLISGEGKSKILAEEERWKKEEERKQWMTGILKKVYIGLYIILLFLGIYLPFRVYLKYGREPKLDYQGEYEHEPPDDSPPAWVDMLINQSNSVSPNSIVASTLELARRGYIKIQEEIKEGFLGRKHKDHKIVLTGKKMEDNLSGEMRALLLQFEEFGDEFYISELGKKDLSDFKERFDKLVENYVYNERKWINEEGKWSIYGLSAIWTGLLVLYGVLFMFMPWLRNDEFLIYSILMMVVLGINIILTLLFLKPTKRYSPEGKLLALKWRAFKRFLQDFSLISQYPPSSLVLWEKYLVYGTVLGVAKEVLKAMEMLRVPIDKIDWYTPAMVGSMGSLAESFESFNSSLESFSSAFASSVVSSTSSGSSGGGGSGGGGGGGGAD